MCVHVVESTVSDDQLIWRPCAFIRAVVEVHEVKTGLARPAQEGDVGGRVCAVRFGLEAMGVEQVALLLKQAELRDLIPALSSVDGPHLAGLTRERSPEGGAEAIAELLPPLPDGGLDLRHGRMLCRVVQDMDVAAYQLSGWITVPAAAARSALGEAGRPRSAAVSPGTYVDAGYDGSAGKKKKKKKKKAPRRPTHTFMKSGGLSSEAVPARANRQVVPAVDDMVDDGASSGSPMIEDEDEGTGDGGECNPAGPDKLQLLDKKVQAKNAKKKSLSLSAPAGENSSLSRSSRGGRNPTRHFFTPRLVLISGNNLQVGCKSSPGCCSRRPRPRLPRVMPGRGTRT